MRQRSRVSIFCWSTNFNLNDHTVSHFKIFRFLNAHSNRHKISTIFVEQEVCHSVFPIRTWTGITPQPYVTLAEIVFKSRLGSSGMATKRKGAGPRQWKISPLNSKIIVTVYQTPIGTKWWSRNILLAKAGVDSALEQKNLKATLSEMLDAKCVVRPAGSFTQ